MKFLIVKPSSLGDILHAFPAVSMLLSVHPGSEVHWVVQPAFSGLMEYLPGVTRWISFDRTALGRVSTFSGAFRSLVRDLRTDFYDAAIDLQGLIRSAGILSMARSGCRCGPAHPKEAAAALFYGRKLEAASGALHALEKNSSMMADFLGRREYSCDYEMPVIPHNRDSARRLFAGSPVPYCSRLVVISPGARWETKQWPPSFFSALIRELAGKGEDLAFVLAASPSEAELSRELVRGAGDLPLLDLTGKTSLGELVEILRSASLFICNDSGPMHIASMLGIPVLALFGPTSPELTGPYCRRKTVLQPELDCIRCMKRYCDKKLCHSALDPAAAAAEGAALLKN